MPEPILFNIYLVLLFVSLLCSTTVYFRKTAFSYLKLFPPFLLLTLIIETIASKTGGTREYNKVYNIFFIVEVVFYFSIFHRVIRNRLVKKALIPILVGYTAFAIINLSFIQGIEYAPYNFNLGALLIVGFCIFCFNELFKATTFLEIMANPLFWICIGVLIFYACTFPIWAGTYVLLKVPEEEWKILAIVLDIANMILYSSITMAFFCEVIFKRIKSEK